MKHKISIATLRAMKQAGEKITSLTAYDASFARILDAAGIEVVLIGDSLGMVLHGEDDTLNVTMDNMIYHTRLVSRGIKRSLIVTDMPNGSYSTREQALENSLRLINEGGAEVVKLEGGDENVLGIVEHLCTNNIKVCGHIGLQPQSVIKYGGYRVQGRNKTDAERIFAEAKALESAGIELLVLECIPAVLANRITHSINAPTIGIGAGAGCDGQVLVLYDALGISSRLPKMARNFLTDCNSVKTAVQNYINTVKSGTFPGPEHSYE